MDQKSYLDVCSSVLNTVDDSNVTPYTICH